MTGTGSHRQVTSLSFLQESYLISDDLEIRRLFDPRDPDVTALVAKSDEYMSSLYPPASNHVESMDVLVSENSAFFVGYVGAELVVCGAAKIARDDGIYGEIKRVFVAEEHRGRNLATVIMEHLEDHLRRSGIDTVRLEAGPKQPAALSFYRKLGYTERGPFGRYIDDPLSVFMEKTLSD